MNDTLCIGYLLLFYTVGGVLLRQRGTYDGSGSAKVNLKALFRMRPNRTRCTGLEDEQLTIHDLEDDSQVNEMSDNTASSCLSCVEMGNRYRFSVCGSLVDFQWGERKSEALPVHEKSGFFVMQVCNAPSTLPQLICNFQPLRQDSILLSGDDKGKKGRRMMYCR